MPREHDPEQVLRLTFVPVGRRNLDRDRWQLRPGGIERGHQGHEDVGQGAQAVRGRLENVADFEIPLGCRLLVGRDERRQCHAGRTQLRHGGRYVLSTVEPSGQILGAWTALETGPACQALLQSFQGRR